MLYDLSYVSAARELFAHAPKFQIFYDVFLVNIVASSDLRIFSFASWYRDFLLKRSEIRFVWTYPLILLSKYFGLKNRIIEVQMKINKFWGLSHYNFLKESVEIPGRFTGYSF